MNSLSGPTKSVTRRAQDAVLQSRQLLDGGELPSNANIKMALDLLLEAQELAGRWRSELVDEKFTLDQIQLYEIQPLQQEALNLYSDYANAVRGLESKDFLKMLEELRESVAEISAAIVKPSTQGVGMPLQTMLMSLAKAPVRIQAIVDVSLCVGIVCAVGFSWLGFKHVLVSFLGTTLFTATACTFSSNHPRETTNKVSSSLLFSERKE